MKFAALLVTFGIILYCGVYMLFYSMNFNSQYSQSYTNIGTLTPDKLSAEMSVKTDIATILCEFDTSGVRPEFLGFEIGEPVTVHYYLLRVENERGKKPFYTAFATSDESQVSAIERGAKRLSVSGNIKKSDMIMRGKILDCMAYREPELIREDFGFVTTETLKMYISDYYVASTVRYSTADYVAPVIIGAVLTLAGGAGLFVLIFKKAKHHNAY